MKLRSPPLAKPGEINYAFFDRFTFVHFGVGVLYSIAQIPISFVFLLAILWELVENPLKAYLPFIFPHATKDTYKNALGDILAVVLGSILTYFIKSRL